MFSDIEAGIHRLSCLAEVESQQRSLFDRMTFNQHVSVNATRGAYSARMTMGLADTVVPVRCRCFSVMALMASATALSGTIGGPYSSESSSCSRHRGSKQSARHIAF